MDHIPSGEDLAYYDRNDARPHAERSDAERQMVLRVASDQLRRTRCHPCVPAATHDRLLANAVSRVIAAGRVFNGEEIVATAEKAILRHQSIFGDLAPERREREARLARKARAAANHAAAELRSATHKANARARRQARLLHIG